jgi:hypothetical protein
VGTKGKSGTTGLNGTPAGIVVFVEGLSGVHERAAAGRGGETRTLTRDDLERLIDEGKLAVQRRGI